MRIDPNKSIDKIYELSRVGTAPAAGTAASHTGEAGMPRDKVEISVEDSHSDGLYAVKARIMGDVEKGTDAGRLRRLKADIEADRYHVSSEDIASAILNENE